MKVAGEDLQLPPCSHHLRSVGARVWTTILSSVSAWCHTQALPREHPPARPQASFLVKCFDRGLVLISANVGSRIVFEGGGVISWKIGKGKECGQRAGMGLGADSATYLHLKITANYLFPSQ